MSTAGPKALFLIALAAIGIIIAAAIYQVPQPVRGFLVAFMLVMFTLGSFLMRLVGHHYQFKSLQLTLSGGSQPPPRRGRARDDTPMGQLRIVQAGRAGAGRHIIR